MTPNELYAMTPERYDHDIAILWGCYYCHVPELEEAHNHYTPFEADKIMIKYYKDHSFDGRRVWILASVWFEGSPVMIIQNAGREGDDWAERYITDPDRYQAMVEHIQTLIPVEPTRTEDRYNEDEEIKSLTSFYGHSLNDNFEHW